MAGTIKAGTLTDGANTMPVDALIKCSPLAYIVADTLAAPVNIKSQYNISSITDLGVGVHTLNFAKPMPNANYYVVGGTLSDSGNGGGTLSLKVSGAFNAGPVNKTINAVTVILWSNNAGFNTKDLYVVIGGGV